MRDLPKRSWAKAVSWRITASLATFTISFIIAADISIAGSIAAVQLVVNFLLYFLHERLWNRVNWGVAK